MTCSLARVASLASRTVRDSPRRVVVAVMIQPAGLGFEPIDLRGAKPPDDKCCYLIMPERLVHVDPAAAARAVWSSRDG